MKRFIVVLLAFSLLLPGGAAAKENFERSKPHLQMVDDTLNTVQAFIDRLFTRGTTTGGTFDHGTATPEPAYRPESSTTEDGSSDQIGG